MMLRHIVMDTGTVRLANLGKDQVRCWNDQCRVCSDNCSAFAIEEDNVVYCNAAGAPIGRLLNVNKEK